MRLLTCIILFALSACTSFPELDGTIAPADENAAYPTLVPLAPLLAEAQGATQTRITPASIATLENRLGRLRGKARGLRGPVIDAATRARMRAAARRAALR
jgi:hypothetical protein